MNQLSALSRFGRGGLLAAAIAGSLMFGNVAYAKDVGAEAGRKISISRTEPLIDRYNKLQDLLDTSLAITDKGSKNLTRTKDLLYRTAIHESGQLKNVSQIGGGPAKSIYQIEPDTAVDVIQRWAAKRNKVLASLEKTSGLTRNELLTMGKSRLGELLESNQLFATSVARYRYQMDPGSIPAGLKEQATYWQKAYQRGGKKVRSARIDSFMKSNRKFAKSLSEVMVKQQKTLSKGGTATSKAVKFLQKIMR